MYTHPGTSACSDTIPINPSITYTPAVAAAAAAAANSFLNEGENLIFRQNVTQVNGGAAANIDPPGGSYSTSFGD